jgi:hypothetical protein
MPKVVRTSQAGFMLILIPVMIVAFVAIGIQMINRSRTAMRMTASELNHLPTQLCARNCLALTANRHQLALNLRQTVRAGETGCDCGDQDPPSVGCSVETGDPEHRVLRDCYGLAVSSTVVDIEAVCGGDRSFAADMESKVDYREYPIFQFAVFYQHHLILNNGQPMAIEGRVHGNDTIEISPGNALSIQDWITSHRSITTSRHWQPHLQGFTYFARMNGALDRNAVRDGNPRNAPLHVRIPGYPTWKKDHRVAYAGQPNGCGPVPRFMVPVKDMVDYHELIDWRSPKDDINRKRVKFAYNADLIFDGGWKDRELDPVAMAPDPVRIPSSPTGWKTTLVDGRNRVILWDPREEKQLRLLPIDVAALQDRSPRDAVIYLRDELRDPAQEGSLVGGFMLHSGRTLKRPLTIVTNTRLVLLGDFNTHAGYEFEGRKYPYPAALASDHFIQLSNAFRPAENVMDDGFNGRIIERHSGDRTTVHSCLLTGDSYDGDGHAESGVQNLTRFIENWNGSEYRRSGSVVCLWKSRDARKLYQENALWTYRPPNRNYSFSNLYQHIANMPPGTPRLTTPTLVDLELVRD